MYDVFEAGARERCEGGVPQAAKQGSQELVQTTSDSASKNTDLDSLQTLPSKRVQSLQAGVDQGPVCLMSVDRLVQV